ncbi:MAG: hypothetical protein ABIK07_13430 [Planctomycetota bacterium]
MYWRTIFFTLLVWCVTGPASEAMGESGQLRAGASAVEVSPHLLPVSLRSGKAMDKSAIHDPLHARAIVLNDGKTIVAIAVLDALGAPPEMLNEAKLITSKKTGIPVDRILISSTHTHSAPPSNRTTGSPGDVAYRGVLINGLAQSIIQAFDKQQTASLGVESHDLPEEVFNRRWFLKPGKMPPNPFGKMDIVKMNPGTSAAVLERPAGPVDPELMVLSIQDQKRKPLALPEVRVHALRLSEQRTQSSNAVRDQLLAMGEDRALQVRYQLAFSLGELKSSPERNEVLASLAMRDGQDKWMELAVLSSLAEGAGSVFQRLAREAAYRQSKQGTRFLTALARQTGAAGRKQETEVVLNSLLKWSAAQEQQEAVLLALLAAQPDEARRDFMSRHQASLQPIMGRVLEDARKEALNTHLRFKQRLTAISRLDFAPYPDVQDVFSELLEPQQVNPVQVAAIIQLGQFPDQNIASLLISRWPKMTPDLRMKAVETLLSRAAWSRALIAAIEGGSIGRGDLSPARVDLLKQHPDKTLAGRVQKLYADRSLARRDEVVQQYHSALKVDGDVTSGKAVFKKVCSACHRLEGVGTAVGADLKAIRDRGKAGVLLHILDPNREVKPQYMSYTLVLESGQVLSGMIADESVNSITVRKPDGTAATVLRINIEEIRSSGLSFMPEGLEKQIDERAMADLLAYLISLKADVAGAED